MRSPPLYRRIPAYPRGPKPRRRTELGLLLFGDVIVIALYVLASLGRTSRIPAHLGPFLGIVLALSLVAHLFNRWLVPDSNPVILPLVALLNGIGYVVIARWAPTSEGPAQAGWTAIGVLLYFMTLLFLRRSRDLDRYRYLLLLVGVALILAPLVPGIGVPSSQTNGARLWVHLGHDQFQPIEIAKILLCIFFASYFAERKELLSIPTVRVGNRLVLDPRHLVPIVIAWGFAMVVIAKENDIGFAGLVFVLFVGLLWVSTGRYAYLVLGILIFALGVYIASHLFSQFHERVVAWLDPERYPSSSGYQLLQGWYAMGTGGVGGVGLGTGIPGLNGHIPFITSDMVFAAIGEEMGLMGTSVVVVAFLLLAGAGLRVAQTARSDFAKLLATGLTILLAFQAFFIMAG